MATPTTTIATTTIPFGSCAAESETAHPFSFAALYRAYRSCRRGKRGTRKAQRYETRLLDHLANTAQALQSKTWRPSRAIRFVVTHPKPREILAAEFGDRVVHHLLVPWLERHFEPVFIDDSFANRKGRGSHAAVARLQAFTRRAPGGWYLQLDIANFFNSIGRRTLFALVQHRVARDRRRRPDDSRHAASAEADDMLWLARRLLTGNPAQGAIFQGRTSDLTRVPAHKQLLNAPPETGLPIGNLTSQFFANVYLNELDQFVKHQLKFAPVCLNVRGIPVRGEPVEPRPPSPASPSTGSGRTDEDACPTRSNELKFAHYLRYVDDFVIVHPDRALLEQIRIAITDFLAARLGLRLRDAGRLAPVANGIDFLGYIVRPRYRLVRRRVVGNLRDRLAAHRRAVCRPLRKQGDSLFLAPGRVDAIVATLASYEGHFCHAQAGGLMPATLAQHPWLVHICQRIDTAQGPRLRRTDVPPQVSSMVSQWRYFQHQYPAHVVMMQVGNAWECAAPAGIALPAMFCRQAGARPGLPPTWRVNFQQLAALKRWLCRQGQAWCEVAESGYLKGGLKRRRLVALWPWPQAVVLRPDCAPCSVPQPSSVAASSSDSSPAGVQP